MNAQPTASPDAPAQEATLRAIREHHEVLGQTMAQHALTLRRDIDRLLSPHERRDRMVDFCADEVLPHALAEEATLYAAGADLPETRLLVQAMTDEHAVLRELLDELRQANTVGEVAGAASALDVLFQVHLRKENDVLLPALVAAGVDLAALLGGMHEILGEQAHATCGHRCACGGHDTAGDPDARAEPVDGELDVRRLPHGRRHEEIFAAYAALRPGEAFVLVNDHDPKPLHYQFAAEHTGEFSWDYLETGPEEWRVRIGRR